MKPYEVTKSEVTYRGAIINVVQDTIVLPDGREALRETVVHGGAAAVIPVDEEGRIVFVRQYRHPTRDLVLEIPAGTLEKDEDPFFCASRELEEETGLKSENITFIMKLFTSIGFCTEVIYIYLAEHLTPGTQNLDPDEFVTIERYTLEDAVDMIFKGDIRDGKTIAAILTYKDILTRRHEH